MTDAVKWMVESSKFMAKDRPDLYATAEAAFSDLSEIFDNLSERDCSAWTAWSGFLLHKHVEFDGDEIIAVEWTLTKKISSVAIFPQDNVAQVNGWTEGSGTLKSGVDLPSPGTV